MFFRISFLLTLLPFSIFSRGVDINLQVLQCLSPQAKLYMYRGSQTVLVDSSGQHQPGTYRFSLAKGHAQGLYRINVGKTIAFNIVVANEPTIDVKTVAYAPEDSLRSDSSMENTVYWKFQKEKRRIYHHTWLLRSLVDLYPDSAPFRHQLMGEKYRLELEQLLIAQKLQEAHPHLLASKLIAIELRPVAPPFIEADLFNKYLTENWWNRIDLHDQRIITSPELSKYLWGYVEALFNDGFDKEQQDSHFIQGIDRLMHMPMEQSMRAYLRALLIDGFADSDYHAVLEHLQTSSFGELRALVSPKDYWSNRGDLPQLRIGDKVFDFSSINKNGKLQKLSKIRAKYKLLVFWSSWCPHCIETLPRIVDVYGKYSRSELEVVAICIDEDDKLFKEYVASLKLNWINHLEPNTGSSKLIHMYNVTETPKMFLLSEDLRIVSKPSTRRQLELKLKQLLR